MIILKRKINSICWNMDWILEHWSIHGYSCEKIKYYCVS